MAQVLKGCSRPFLRSQCSLTLGVEGEPEEDAHDERHSSSLIPSPMSVSALRLGHYHFQCLSYHGEHPHHTTNLARIPFSNYI